MKTLLTTIGAAMVTITAIAAPRIKWLQPVYDFGAFNETGGNVTATFLYTNTGDEALVITGARANCGCTTPVPSYEPLAPGDTAALVVTYDPSGRPGRFSKHVYVDTNTEPRRSTLTVQGVVVGAPSSVAGRYPFELGPLRMTHRAILLGEVKRGHIKSLFENLYNASTDTLRPTVTDAPAWLQVKTLPAAAGPGEQISMNYYVDSSRIPSWDMVTDTVTIRPDPESPLSMRLPVIITVTEDFSSLTDKQLAQAPAVQVSPRRLDPVKPGQKATFTITNTGRSPLKVHRLYTAANTVTTDIRPEETIKPGKTRTVTVTTAPSAPAPSAIIMLLITNDPLNPRTTLTLPLQQ